MARLDITDLRERCRALPQKFVLELLGFRQWIELQRFADKWRLPIGGTTTDLFAMFRELRLFVAKYGTIISALIEDIPADGSEGELGVRYLRAKIAKTEADAQAAELRNAHKEGRLCDRAEVRAAFGRIASVFQNAAGNAQRKWGADGFDFFVALAENIGAELQTLIVDDPEATADEADERSPKSTFASGDDE